MTKRTKREEKIVRLRRKDGTEFVGDPITCAEILMRDALNHRLHTGQNYAIWEAQDFCRHFGIGPMIVAKNVGYNEIII